MIYGLPEPILLVEPQGTVVAANPGASRLFQRPSRELVGKLVSELVTDHPHQKLSRYLRRCLRSSEGVPGSLTILSPNEKRTICKALGRLVQRAEQPRLVWLRFLPREPANRRFATYQQKIEALSKENRARQQNEQRWRAAFENSAIGIMMADLAGRFFAANSAFKNMLGYKESELYQLTFFDVTHEDDRRVNLKLVKELLDGERQYLQIEKRYCRKDGTLLWALTNVALVPGIGAAPPFWFAVVEDITQRKRIEEELRERDTRLQAFFANSPNPIFLKDRQGRYLYVNREFERALGVTADQIKEKRDDEIFSALHSAAFQANDRKVLEAGVAMEFEEVAVLKDGQHTSIVHKFPLFNSHGEIYAIGGIVTDITERKREESARREREKEVAHLQPRFDSLTPREQEVIYRVVSGMLNKQIAGQLGTAENTVKVHRSRAMAKMRAQSLAHLIRMIDKLKGPSGKAS